MKISTELEPTEEAASRHQFEMDVSHEVFNKLNEADYLAYMRVSTVHLEEGPGQALEVARRLHDIANQNKTNANGRYIMPDEKPKRRRGLRVEIGKVNIRIPLPSRR